MMIIHTLSDNDDDYDDDDDDDFVISRFHVVSVIDILITRTTSVLAAISTESATKILKMK
jgi:hypothetical protein